MVSTAADSFGAFFIAYDPTRETEETMEFTEGLAGGELFTTPDDDGIILGHILAANLGAELGDKVVYTLTDRSGEIVRGQEKLTGIVRTGADSTDAALVLLPIGTVRSVIGYDPHETTQVAIFLGDGRRSIQAAERIDGKIGPEASVLTWDQVQPEIKAFVAMKIGGGRVFEIVIAVLVAAGIFNTIFMSVLERTREFGIMRAVGYSARQIFALVMFESGFLAILGLIASIGITALPYYYLHGTGIDMTEIYAQQGASIDIGGVGMDPILHIGIFPENAVSHRQSPSWSPRCSPAVWPSVEGRPRQPRSSPSTSSELHPVREPTMSQDNGTPIVEFKSASPRSTSKEAVDVHALRGLDLDREQGRVRGASGAPRARARPRHSTWWARSTCRPRAACQAGRHRARQHGLNVQEAQCAAARPHRLRVPVLQPHPRAHRLRERRGGGGAARARPRSRAAGSG